MPSIKSPSGLMIEDLVVGTGDAANAGQKVSVHYTGWTTDGKKFDSSKDRGQAFMFSLGRGEVIRGWDEGVAGMKVGGKRKLTIPPDLGYGSRGAGGAIPPNATLLFEVGLPPAPCAGTAVSSTSDSGMTGLATGELSPRPPDRLAAVVLRDRLAGGAAASCRRTARILDATGRPVAVDARALGSEIARARRAI